MEKDSLLTNSIIVIVNKTGEDNLLQHKNVIPFTAHSTLIEKIELFN